jgi:RNA polymerase-binding transcription factor DksA
MSATLDTSPTSASAWEHFRTLLEGQRALCLRQREEALAECAQSLPDPVAQRRSADLQATIGEIDAALARIDAGTYGTCVHCGTAIPVERLQMRPFAGACVTCARSH